MLVRYNPRDYYELENAFNFLVLLFNPFYRLSSQMVATKGCCVVFFEDYTIADLNGRYPTQVKIEFYPYRIQYKFHNVSHVQDNRPTVEYIYFLMSRIKTRWMKKVLRHVMKPVSLALQCKMKMPFAKYESLLRRFLMSNGTFLRQRCWKGKMESADEYVQHFKNLMSGKRTLDDYSSPLERRNLRQTMYMHDFFLNGVYSHLMNFYTLPYLLLGEAVLLGCHKWQEIFNDCFHCQIEKYHMMVWRHRWVNNFEFYIFTTEQIARYMKHRGLPYKETSLVNHPQELTDNLMTFQYKFCDMMLEGMFGERFPLRVKSLSELCEFQLAMNLLIKRLDHYSKIADDHNYLTPTVYETNGAYTKWLRVLMKEMWAFTAEHLMTVSYRYKLNGKRYRIRPDPLKTKESIKKVLMKGCSVPLQAHHSLAKMSETFKGQYDIQLPFVL